MLADVLPELLSQVKRQLLAWLGPRWTVKTTGVSADYCTAHTVTPDTHRTHFIDEFSIVHVPRICDIVGLS